MIGLIGINIYCLLFIMIGGIWTNYQLRYGDVVKRALDLWTNKCQGISIFCNLFFCEYFLCKDCWWGSLKGLWIRHCCASNISIFPLYNVFSVLSSFTSIIYRCRIGRNQIFLYLILNGCTTALITITHSIFIYVYIIGNTEFLDDYPFFYFIELEICTILWCLMLIHTIKDHVCLRSLIIPSIYLYMIFILSLLLDVEGSLLSHFFDDIPVIHYEKDTLSHLISILGFTQLIVFIVAVLLILVSQAMNKISPRKYPHFYVNHWLFIIRSLLLVRYTYVQFYNSIIYLRIHNLCKGYIDCDCKY